jgi:RNase H-fold protein (predicted Holliday junction resolvase)
MLVSATAARDLLRAAAAAGSWILAADPGATKIGVAACAAASAAGGGAPPQPQAPRSLGALRAPPRPLPQRERDAALAARLAALARGGLGAGRRVGLVLVGLPLAPDGRRDGAAGGCARAEALATHLRGLGVAAPTVLWDERGSSAAARARLRAEGVEGARRRLFGGGGNGGEGGGGGGGGGSIQGEEDGYAFAYDEAARGGSSGGRGGAGERGGDAAITRALRLRQRAARALPPGVRERVDGEAAVEILLSFLFAAAEAASAETEATMTGRSFF